MSTESIPSTRPAADTAWQTRRRRLAAWARAVALALLVGSVAPAGGQEAPRPAPARAQGAQAAQGAQGASGAPGPLPGFGEIVEVRVIDVEAVVTRSGERVRDLDADDFVLEVDGETVPIEYFTEISGGVPVDPRTAAGERGSAAEPSTLPAAAAGRPVPTWYLVFVDDYFSIASRRNGVLRALGRQLDHLGPDDRMAIVGYDGREITLLTTWTRSRGELRSALRQAENRPAYGLQQRSEWRRLTNARSVGSRRTRAGSSFSSIGFSGSARAGDSAYEPGRELAGQVSRVASAAASALRGFARPDGRRVMLLLTAGLPTAGSVGSLFEDRGPSGLVAQAEDRRHVERLVSPLVDSANRLGYTLYPVDLGDPTGRFVGADVGSLAQASRLRSVLEQDELLREDALLHLADRTGGVALLEGARMQALERAAADTRSYYWLGFSPTWQGNDDEHTVRLRLRDERCPRCKIRSRRSFADLSRASLLTMQVESAHLFDLPIPEARSFDARPSRAEPISRGRVEVPIELRIPTDALTFLPGPQGVRTRLELRVAATDDRGNDAEVPVVPIELTFSDRPAAGTVVTASVRLELRRRSHRLLLVLTDPVGDTLLAHRLELRP